MLKLHVPLDSSEWQELGMKQENASLMSIMGVIEGDILGFLEGKSSVRLVELIDNVRWPSLVVVMSVGALVRQGLVLAKKIHDSIVIEPLVA